MPKQYRSGSLWGYDCDRCLDFIVGKPDKTGKCEACQNDEIEGEIARADAKQDAGPWTHLS